MKRKVLSILLCMAMAVSVMACGNTASSTTTATEGSSDSGTDSTASKDIKISVVLHAMNSSFYTKMSDGAKAAGEDLGITVDVTSPTTASNLSEQVGLLESCITAGYDGIATVLWDPSGFNSVIQKASDAGIPVLAFNMNAEDSGSVAFVGQEYEDAGYQLGKYMFEEVMGGEGKYVIASCAPADTALIARADGIKRAAEEFPGIEFVDIIDIGTDLTGAVGVIENAYLANPDIDAILGVDVFSEAIGTFIASNKLQDTVKAAGFDLTEGTLKHISNGDMQLTVGQNPFLQGYYSVVELYNNLANDAAFIDINTGAQLVTADNVSEVTPE
ncbi:MAG: substrate-binding domain-containing protein [Lachnospiraceae bacterium]